MKKLHKYFFFIIIITTSCSEVKIKTGDNYELVKLPDSTYVFLNKNSTLTYDEDFSQRQLTLQGEAYFDVTKGNKPFVVKTSLGEVKVTGTEFNVSSTNNDLKVQVKKGTVAVKAKDQLENLKPGQQVTFANNKMKKSKADLDYDAWLSAMHMELNKLGKEFRRGAKIIKNDSRKIGKNLRKEVNRLKENIK